jgi:POT family proton-dependent oligopeptide transporter
MATEGIPAKLDKNAFDGEVQEMFGHPKGLFYLFFAEMWERFSFYGMRALLTLYMTKVLFFGDANGEKISITIYAAYGALVYATPFIGGMIADKLLGYRKAIMLGGIFMAVGHFVLAIESDIAFYSALALIIVGNGFFKPNISSFVGTLYREGDARRDAGFTIFYMGINVGAAAAPLICGWLGETYGWHWGFGAAGVGMLLGLGAFWNGMRGNVFGEEGHPPEGKGTLKQMVEAVVYVGAFISVPIFTFLMWQNEYVSWILYAALAVSIAYVVFIFTQVSKEEAQRVFVVCLLTFFITVFWSFFEQSGSSLTLFADNNVNLVWLNASQTNFINPAFIVIFAILFSMMWVQLSKRGLNPITPIKFALGIAQLGLGFLIFAFAIRYVDDTAKVPMIFLVLGYLFMTTGELFISPVGLSKVTELTPKQYVGFMMGVWFLSSAFAHHIAGIIANLTASGGKDAGVVSEPTFIDALIEMVTGISTEQASGFSEGMEKLYTYSTVFSQVGFAAIGFAIFALLLSPWMKKWMHGIK